LVASRACGECGVRGNWAPSTYRHGILLEKAQICSFIIVSSLAMRSQSISKKLLVSTARARRHEFCPAAFNVDTQLQLGYTSLCSYKINTIMALYLTSDCKSNSRPGEYVIQARTGPEDLHALVVVMNPTMIHDYLPSETMRSDFRFLLCDMPGRTASSAGLDR
jgi:hypothetical protein